MKGTSYLCILIAGALWGLNGLFFRLLNGSGFDPVQVTFLKMFVGSVFLSCFLLVKKPVSLRIRPRDLWIFCGAGMISVLFYNFCYFTALNYTGVAVAISLVYTSPAFVVLISAALFKEKITAQKLAALLLIFTGCVCTSGIFVGEQMFSPLGIFWGVLGGFCYGLFTIFNRLAIDRGYQAPTIIFYATWSGALAAIPFVDFGGIAAGMSVPAIGGILGIALSCVVANVLYTIGLKSIEAGKAAMLSTSDPVTAALAGIFILHEPISGFVILGIILIIIGIVEMNWNRKSAGLRR